MVMALCADQQAHGGINRNVLDVHRVLRKS